MYFNIDNSPDDVDFQFRLDALLEKIMLEANSYRDQVMEIESIYM